MPVSVIKILAEVEIDLASVTGKKEVLVLTISESDLEIPNNGGAVPAVVVVVEYVVNDFAVVNLGDRKEEVKSISLLISIAYIYIYIYIYNIYIFYYYYYYYYIYIYI